MAPARSTTRRGARQASAPQTDAQGSGPQDEDPNLNKQLFLDPMLGHSLAIYIEKEVPDKEVISQLIVKHGGTVSPGYSRVPYILVDPHKASGQNLYRQYAGKDGKVVLDARWVQECIKLNQLQTYSTNWGGCKVTGTETLIQLLPEGEVDAEISFCSVHVPPQQPQPQPPPQLQEQEPNASSAPADVAAQQIPSQALPPAVGQVPQMPTVYLYPYPHPMPGPPPNAPPGTWTILPPGQPLPGTPASPSQVLPSPPPQAGQQTPDQTYAPGWEGYRQPVDMAGQPIPVQFDYQRFREGGWIPPPPFYDYSQFPQPAFITAPQPPAEQTAPAETVEGQQAQQPVAGPSTEQTAEEPEVDKPRGRKRTRTQPPPATPASALVVNRNPPARSPTPPSRVIKSTYGGNLFTSDDVEYLKKYIDYCQDQCLVLSLREICERIAVKAPHHTFYSWRRYCNKHQIKLGGYTMNNERADSPSDPEDDMAMEVDEVQDPPPPMLPEPAPIRERSEGSNHAGRLDFVAAKAASRTMGHRTRSPSPPRSLYRSTTGKGVAFTQEDVTFLMKLMSYRKSRGNWDAVAFWKDVAQKAPHHSRASWMKFWRRHKHEFEWEDGDEPLPAPPDKKLRYSKGDDVLLAKFFFNKPDGTSDKVFQAFGRQHPHHPWKGWQEHHRIHKAKIDQLIERLANGENLDAGTVDDS